MHACRYAYVYIYTYGKEGYTCNVCEKYNVCDVWDESVFCVDVYVYFVYGLGRVYTCTC